MKIEVVCSICSTLLATLEKDTIEEADKELYKYTMLCQVHGETARISEVGD